MAWFLPLLFTGAATGVASWAAVTFPEKTKNLVANVGDFIIDPEVVKAIEDATGGKPGLLESFMTTRKTDGLQLRTAVFGSEEAAKQLPDALRPKTPKERAADMVINGLDDRTGGAASKIADAMSGNGKEGKGIVDRVIAGLMNTDGGFNFGGPAAVAVAGGGLAALGKMFFGTDLINPKLALATVAIAFAVINWDESMDFVKKLAPDNKFGIDKDPTNKIVVPDRIAAVNLNPEVDLSQMHASLGSAQLHETVLTADDILIDGNKYNMADDYDYNEQATFDIA